MRDGAASKQVPSSPVWCANAPALRAARPAAARQHVFKHNAWCGRWAEARAGTEVRRRSLKVQAHGRASAPRARRALTCFAT